MLTTHKKNEKPETGLLHSRPLEEAFDLLLLLLRSCLLFLQRRRRRSKGNTRSKANRIAIPSSRTACLPEKRGYEKSRRSGKAGGDRRREQRPFFFFPSVPSFFLTTQFSSLFDQPPPPPFPFFPDSPAANQKKTTCESFCSGH